MKHISILSIIVLFCSTFVNAQKKVALNHNGTTTIFGGISPLTDAYNAAQNKDTIYVPGGLYTIPTIQKRITLIGTGYYTDSTIATGRTQINGINIGPGADGTSITGIYISGNLYMDGTSIIDSIFIFRNQVTGNIGFTNGNIDKPDDQKSKGVVIAENRVNEITCENVRDIKVFNNIASGISSAKNGWIRNNVILGTWYGSIYNTKESLIENNYLASTWIYQIHNNSFLNNVFSGDPSADLYNTFVNNYYNHPMANVFVNYIDNNPQNYLNNFHLQNPGIFPANNTTQIGIYAGYYPFKIGGLPVNPHVGSINIGTQTNTNGELPIHIRVTSQNN